MEKSTPTPAPSASGGKLASFLGSDYRRLCDAEAAAYLLIRLTAAYHPKSKDEAILRQNAVEWTRALEGIPFAAADRAVTRWIAREPRWPSPSEIRAAALREVDTRAAEVSDKIHPRRLTPTEEMRGFIFNEARDLRRNETWRRFLDSIHPTLEHCYLANARMRAHAHEIEGLTPYEAETVIEKFGEQLRNLFGRGVSIKETR